MNEYPEIEISKLKLHPLNPNMHEDEQIKQIADNIKTNGFGRSVVISSDFYVLAGEGTYLAVRDILKEDKIPYKFLEPKRKHDEPEAIAYMLADNRLAEFSTTNYGKLDLAMDELKLQHYNLELTGYDKDDLELPDFLRDNVNLDDSEDLPEKKVKTVECPHCGEEFEI